MNFFLLTMTFFFTLNSYATTHFEKKSATCWVTLENYPDKTKFTTEFNLQATGYGPSKESAESAAMNNLLVECAGLKNSYALKQLPMAMDPVELMGYVSNVIHVLIVL